MFKRLKENALKRSVRRTVRDRKIPLANFPMKHLGILLDENHKLSAEQLLDLEKTFDLQKENIHCLKINFQKEKTEETGISITYKDIGPKGKIKDAETQKFIDFSFDVLLTIFNSPNLKLNSLVAQSQAKFKIGFADVDPQVVDLIIHINPSDYKTLKLEVTKYLTLFNKL